MANTYTKIYLHIVFAVKNRGCAISSNWRDKLHEYIGGIIKNYGCIPLIVGGVADHVHILLNLNKNLKLPDLVRDIKTGSTHWINNNAFFRGRFEWQDGYGAFSVSQSMIGKTRQYIANQENHHTKYSFRDEFVELLKAYEIEYDSQYLPYNPLDIEE